jgi:hypothetical protein
MDWEKASTDQLEQCLLESEGVVSQARAMQVEILAELDSRQIVTGDGCRSLSDWVAARLDVSSDTAKTLVRTMRRTADRSDLRDALASGVSFDRVEGLSRIPEPVGLMEDVDVGGVLREAALRVRVTAEAETRNIEDRYMVLQPSLDESWWKFWGGTDGYTGSLMDKVLSEMADQLPPLPDGSRGDPSWRRATALVQLCVSDEPEPAQVTVLVDTRHATETNGEAGVVLEAGPRVGRQALEHILCDAVIEVTARTEDGRYMDYGHKHRVVPPQMRRALLDKYQGVCAIEGCDSRRRLQAHHRIPWSRGGRTDRDNLILLCWYHHHVAVHEQGLEIHTTPEGRTRLRRPVGPRGP